MPGAGPRRFTRGMVKLLGIAVLVIVGFVLLGPVAKAVLWIALIATLAVIGHAVYKLMTGSGSTKVGALSDRAHP